MRKLVVHELIRHTLHNRPTSEIVSGTVRLTYETFYERVLRLADRLGRMGVGKGTVVGVMDVNSHRYLELHYALSLLGAVIHTLNFRLSAEDLLYTIRHAEDEWLFVWEGFADAANPLRGVVPQWVWLTEGGEGPDPGTPVYEELVQEGRVREPEGAHQIEETDPYSIFYTTGTTGRPKGLLYRHRDVLLASLQILHHLAVHETGARAHSGDVFMPLIPFFHIHAWGTAFFVPYLGAKLVLPGRSGPQEQLEMIRKEGVTWSNMVPTQLQMLLAAAQEEMPLPKKVLTGGSPLPTGLAQAARRRGIGYSLIYGGSDQLSASISVVPEGMDPASPEADQILATRTRPLPMVEVDVRNRDGQPVPRDGRTLGEVWVRSPWLPAGYHKDPDRSKESYIDGWFRTGDIAVGYPDGTLYVVDREKDAVKSGGEWIACGILESIISEHPKVAAVAILAKPDEQWGERPLAAVQAREPVTEQELRTFLEDQVRAGRLAKFWIPDTFVFLSELPVTSAGKVHKVALRNQLGLA
ncbi:MAG: AMP-binding protein [Alicyclobacillaceae bacterium]|nr:AMP-binding protein [Alicyclobacillaceae bacterium]